MGVWWGDDFRRLRIPPQSSRSGCPSIWHSPRVASQAIGATFEVRDKAQDCRGLNSRWAFDTLREFCDTAPITPSAFRPIGQSATGRDGSTSRPPRHGAVHVLFHLAKGRKPFRHPGRSRPWVRSAHPGTVEAETLRQSPPFIGRRGPQRACGLPQGTAGRTRQRIFA